MSDAYDQVLEGLTREDEKPPAKAARSAPAGRQKAEKRSRKKRVSTSKQYGDRADESMVQVNASIPKELKPSLFFYLKEDEMTLSELIATAVAKYVQRRGGIIGSKKE